MGLNSLGGEKRDRLCSFFNNTSKKFLFTSGAKKMGRSQDPPELHILKGTRSRVKSEPGALEPLTRMWPCPDHVAYPEAKRLFNDLGAVLIEKGILTALDQSSFELLCVAWGRIQTASAILTKDGAVIEDARGSLKLHPANRLLNMSQKHFDWLSNQFGLTPASRKRLGMIFEKPKNDDNPFDKFMKK